MFVSLNTAKAFIASHSGHRSFDSCMPKTEKPALVIMLVGAIGEGDNGPAILEHLPVFEGRVNMRAIRRVLGV